LKPIQNFDIRIEEPCLENYSEPPEDPLGELSDFEMQLRRFCFECNHQVSIQIGDEKRQVLLDPDICMILEELPEQVSKLSEGQKISIGFPESWIIIDLVPIAGDISCTLRTFGCSSEQNNFELDKTQVLGVLRHFLDEVMEMAVDKGYIRRKEKEEFLRPAFSPDASFVLPG
jgi:hypothetical protein